MSTFSFDNVNTRNSWRVQTEDLPEENAVQENDKATAPAQNPVTVPMTGAKTGMENTTQALTQDGNVPLVGNKTDIQTGDVLVKTGTERTGEHTEHKHHMDKSEVDKFMARYYTGWDKFSDEKKLAYTRRYFKQFRGDRQEAEFNKLYKKGVSEENIEMFGSTLKDLHKAAQVGAANTMLDTDGTLRNKAGEIVAKNVQFLHSDNRLIVMGDVMNKSGKEVRISMARELPHLGKQNEVGGAKIIAATKDEDVINAGAEVAYLTDKKNQTQIASTLFDTGFEKVQKTIASTEGKFDKSNQVDIYKKLMTSEHQSVLNEAATNIYTLYKDNQVMATKLTVATNNEEAINCAASNAYKCDSKVQSEVVSTLEKSGYDSVKETLTAAEKESAEASQSAQSQTVSEKIKTITTSNSISKEAEVRDLLKNASNTEKLALLKSSTLPSSMLYLLLEGNPSMELLSKITDMIGKVDDKTQKTLVKGMNKSYSANIINSRMSLFDSRTQSALVKEASLNGNLNSIDQDKLSGNAKDLFKKLLG